MSSWIVTHQHLLPCPNKYVCTLSHTSQLLRSVRTKAEPTRQRAHSARAVLTNSKFILKLHRRFQKGQMMTQCLKKPTQFYDDLIEQHTQRWLYHKHGDLFSSLFKHSQSWALTNAHMQMQKGCFLVSCKEIVRTVLQYVPWDPIT